MLCSHFSSEAHEQAQHHTQHPQHTFRQAEEEAATMSESTLDAEQAHVESRSALAVFFDDALAVHQAEAMTFVHEQIVVGRGRTDAAGVIDFLAKDGTDVFRRQSTAIVADTQFDKVSSFLDCDFHSPTLLRVFACILQQGIEHKERESTVCLDDSLSRPNRETDAFALESIGVLAKDIQKRLNGEVLDV